MARQAMYRSHSVGQVGCSIVSHCCTRSAYVGWGPVAVLLDGSDTVMVASLWLRWPRAGQRPCGGSIEGSSSNERTAGDGYTGPVRLSTVLFFPTPGNHPGKCITNLHPAVTQVALTGHDGAPA